MEKRDKKIPYEVVIQERKRVDLYGNVVYYIHWFDKYGYNITNEWKFWSKGPKKKVAFTKKYKDESREDEDCEEWEEVDSCWGCYEETDELIKEVMIENGLEE